MMLLMGWSLHQYAIAKAHYTKLEKQQLTADLKGAGELMDWWKARRNDEPGEIKLIAVDPFLDLAWASKMFHNVAIECSPYLR